MLILCSNKSLKIYLLLLPIRDVAQLVEYTSGGRGVAGSSPVIPTLGLRWQAFFMSMEKFRVYIIQSEKSSRYYTGMSNNVERRLEQHNLGFNKSTKNKGPWKLVYSSDQLIKSDALKLERKIKKSGAKRFMQRNRGHA